MKFKLNEKYILKENRFILNEASATDLAKAWNDKLKAVIDPFKAKLKTIAEKAAIRKDSAKIDSIIKKINAAYEDIENSLNMPQIAVDSLKTELNNYITILEQTINGLSKTITNKIAPAELKKFNTLMQNLKNAINVNPTNETSIKKAAEQVKIVQDNFNNVFKLSSAENEQQEVDQLKTTCTDISNKVTDLEKTTTADFTNKSNSDILEYNNIIKDITTKIEEFNKKINLDKLNITGTNITGIQELLTKINTDIDKLADSKFITDRTEASARNTEVEDWAALYKTIGQSDSKYKNDTEFWKDYFNREWGENADLVDSYGIAFINELKNAGFDSVNNPIIPYLKEKETDGKPRLVSFNITKELYPTFHNLLVDGIITGNDLRGTGTFKKNNLVFNKNIFLNASNLQDYLAQQKRLKTYASQLKGNNNSAYISNPGVVLSNIMLKDGKLNDLSDNTILKVKHGDLRPLTEVKQILTQLLGSESESVAIQETGITKNIEKYFTDEKKAKKALVYVCDYFRKAYPRTIDNLVNKIPGIKTIQENPTYDEKRTYDKELDLYMDYTQDKLEILITRLAKVAKLVK